MENKTRCLISFVNNPQKVYYGGQALNGRVVLTLYKTKPIRGLSINIRGKAYCRWTEGIGDDEETYIGEEWYLAEKYYLLGDKNGISINIDGKAYCRWTEGSGDNRKTYIGEECYLSEKNYLLGDKHGEIELAPGVYEYNFQCVLPSGLPTSVEGARGHIRYSALVCLDRPLWPDQEFEEGFTVIKPLNLNHLPDLRYPIEKEQRKTFSYCCCLCCFQSKPMFIIGRLPVSGFTPGETIQLSVRFVNRSTLEMYSFETILRKVITYRTSKDSARTKQDNVTVHGQTIQKGCQRNHTEQFTVNILIPAIPPTDITTSNICKVEYKIEITGHITGCHTNPTLLIPVTIGTIPFNNGIDMSASYPNQLPYPILEQSTMSMPMPMPITMTMPEEGGSNISSPTAPPIQQDSSSYDCDPPTYMEAISGKVDIMGKSFAPMYPVYNSKKN